MKPVEEKAVVIATVPLTKNEKWIPLENYKVHLFENWKFTEKNR